MTDPFAPSPELAAITKRWLMAYSARHASAVVNLFSKSAATTYIGSSDGEIWSGDELRETFAAYTDDQAKLIPENIEVQAFEAGSFGWAYTTLTIVAPEADKRVKFRNSFIFTLEDAVWRLVHIHNSNPRPNFETMGYELPNFEELAAAARSAAIGDMPTGIASVMFTDIVDSTSLSATVGDAIWTRIVKVHFAEITALVEGAGGTMVKSLGDGTLSAFPSAKAAMNTAIAIQKTVDAALDEPRLQVRIGLHTGEVVQSDADVLGAVVNKAARVAGVAQSSEICVSDATRIMVGGASEFTFSNSWEAVLKGLEGEHLIHRLDWR